MLFLHALTTALVLPASPSTTRPAVVAPRAGQVALKTEVAINSEVAGALSKLFGAFDSNSDGFITLSNMMLSDSGRMQTGGEWEARQARVGSRRLRRLFSGKQKLSEAEFVETLGEEFERRIGRGLKVGRAVTEIQVNMPAQSLIAAEYGNE